MDILDKLYSTINAEREGLTAALTAAGEQLGKDMATYADACDKAIANCMRRCVEAEAIFEDELTARRSTFLNGEPPAARPNDDPDLEAKSRIELPPASLAEFERVINEAAR